jgi:hypothetical protein
MDERLRSVARLLESEKMAALCREFDVSRKAGYKIFSAIRTAASRDWPIALGGPTGRPTSCRCRWRPDPARRQYGQPRSLGLRR